MTEKIKPPIKSYETCARCYWQAHNPGCEKDWCGKCHNQNPNGCNCLTVKDGEPCVFYKPLKEAQP